MAPDRGAQPESPRVSWQDSPAGEVRIDHLPEGLRCEISFRHDAPMATFDPADDS
jgi:hypothetical protein